MTPDGHALLREHTQTARGTAWVYLLLATGFILLITAFQIEPVRDCIETVCPWQWRALAGLLGLLAAGGAAALLLRNTEWGSRVDVPGRELVWWHGARPRRENIIAVDDIALVLVETKWDSDRLIVKDLAGQTVYLPAECVPHPLAGWAAALVREFPHVRFEAD